MKTHQPLCRRFLTLPLSEERARNKLVTAILTVLMLLLVVPSKALAATGDSGLPYYVSDVAEILSDGQRQDLESTAEKISSQYGCGVYIVTLDDYREYDSKSDMFSFAQDFYRSYQLGIGDSKSGILLLLSMADRDYSLVTYGSKAHYAFTDYGQRVIASEFLDDFRENEWYEGFSDYLSCCGDLLNRADRGEPLDVVYNEHSRMNSGLSLAVIIGVPLLISFFACEMMKRQTKKRLPLLYFRAISGRNANSHHSGGRNPFWYELHFDI